VLVQASAGASYAAGLDRGARVRLQHGLNSIRIVLNNTFEQKVIFDPAERPLFAHPDAAVALV
jgi:hypothetical protein